MDILFSNEFNYISIVVRLVAAAVMGGLIGSERGRHGRAAGLRTHILICTGAAMTSLTSLYLSQILGYDGDVARISAQVISGIGFLGTGTILIRNSSVITGLTTAAGIWTTAAIGIAVGYGFYLGAFMATFICMFSITVLSITERKRKNFANIYIELTDISDTEKIIDIVQGLESSLLSYDVIPPKSGCRENVGIIFSLNSEEDFVNLKNQVYRNGNVAMVLSNIGL